MKPSNNTVIAASTLVLLLIWLLHFPRQYRPGQSSPTSELPSISPSEDNSTSLDVPPLGFSSSTFTYDDLNLGWPLERLCNETKWTSGLIYICDNNSGGIGNIRAFILTCIRYAIEAGTTGLILPRIQARSKDDLANIFSGSNPFTYFFDEEHFRYMFTTYCPQVTIYNDTSDVPHSEDIMKAENFFPKGLAPDDVSGPSRHLPMFRTRFDKWLNETYRIPSVEEPVTVRFGWPVFFEWRLYADGPEFAATYGSILKIRADINSLADSAVTTLREIVYNSTDQAQDPSLPTSDYLGVHLRTESDALGFWPKFEELSDGFLKESRKRDFRVAYLACGDSEQANKFEQKAQEEAGLKTVTKMDLLQDEELGYLKSLSWDQQALVDYQVLLHSRHFVGSSFSSFSVLVALRRHLLTDGIMTRPWQWPGDRLSTLFGRFDKYEGDWLWLQDGMWP